MSSNSKYIPHIDGLRTIAVISVILYHLDVPLLTGGFTGVDIFFVISGYLITNILKSAAETKRLSFTSFYARRARRLFPAFICVILISAIAGYLTLSPAALVELSHSAIYTLLSISNFYFYFNGGYFDFAANDQVFLHTWSLAVEEQFYLVWPLLIFLVVTKIPRNYQIPFFLGLIIFGLLASFIMTGINPDLAFYMMPFRIAEFGIGSLLCWLSLKETSSWLNETAVITGLMLIFIAFLTINSTVLFPGIVVIVPCIGTALIIFYGRNSTISHFILANAPMAYLGRISYSLYLYHWPTILFYRKIYHQDLNFFDGSIIFLITTILAVLTTHLVEVPLKKPSFIWPKNINVAIVYASIASLGIFTFTLFKVNEGYSSRLPIEIRSVATDLGVEKTRRFDLYRQNCGERGWDNCDNFSDNLSNAAILGDSHGIDAINILQPHFSEQFYTLHSINGCPPLNSADFERFITSSLSTFEACKTKNEELQTPAFYQDIDFIIISTRFSWYTPELLERFLSSAPIPSTTRIIIFGNAPSLSTNLPDVVIQHGTKVGLSTFAAQYLDQNTWVFESELADVARKVDAKFISKINFFCDANQKLCELFYGEDQKLLTYDQHHLSFNAAAALGDSLKTDAASLESFFMENP